ncbi:EAL and HDOD domain-containing protein [Cellulomonas fimi]|uniref:Diguanylate phosphodiesterase n=1 Tax=Cellulomonas fimi (strain ATCC 484 / DSM 20113 / JCM 1341 / CCUG 24087 / LMG 16345 / NBRC 15513 / NCIMB 8980 / NCTC 7547 / NRS-133) TaxID=590998 RepID=F4GYS9_CELFA|nr:HDOD domain-containing protein [Cellulomonas fimi]AEE44798.1 diguanylate phosphodiesterase [Cellulomonas fimi ATCC 484]VEH27323.1 HDOD domain [Cellulomonas fimi]
MHDLDPAGLRVGAAVVHRQPIVHPDRSVFGYAVRASVMAPDGSVEPEQRVEHLVEAQYRILDPDLLSGDKLLVLRATTRVMMGGYDLPPAGGGVVVEVPERMSLEEPAFQQIVGLKELGYGIALGDYRGLTLHDELLSVVDYVKIDVADHLDDLDRLVARVQTAGAHVIAERADSRDRIHAALSAGADLLQGPMFERHRSDSTRQLSAGEVQCFELVRLLSEEYPDQDAVVRVVGSDPELTMRVLHLVNSSATGLRRHIDSVRQAVVLVGPRQLGALAMASLVDARTAAVGPLWSVLTRALTCARLTGTDSGYTVGMLSAVASHLRMPVESVIERSGVSAAIADALRDQTGPLGPVLAAVLAHEENDTQAVMAAGFEPIEVAHVHLAAIPEALATATALATAVA